MYTENDINIIKNTIIRDIPGAVGIILFGSYAKKTAGEQSDLDIMVLIENEFSWKEKRDILNRIYQDTGKKGYAIDFILKLKKKYENDRTLPTVSRTIAKEGKVVWMKN